MTGVEILAENAIYITEYIPQFTWKVILSGSFGIVLALFALGMTIGDNDLFLPGIFVTIIAGILICTSINLYKTDHSEEVYSHTEYLATIEETVPLIEFNQKYEIVEQIGELYRIKERIEDG